MSAPAAETVPKTETMDVDVKPEAAVASSSAAPAAPVKIEPADEAEAAEVLARVEFYFNDSNLPYDKFLWTTQGLPTGQGWVSIALVASFKRMRDHLPRGIAWIAEALRRSDGLLEVDEKGEKVRRAKELKPPTDAFGRSAYVKGFPDDTPELQAEMEAWFAQFGKVNAVRKRMTDAKVFKNSVFAEFANMEDLEAFLALDPKPKFKDTEMVTMSKDAYVTMKMVEKGIDPKTKSRGGGSGPVGGKFNAFKQMAAGGDSATGGKRRRGNDDDGAGAGKKAKLDVEIEYLGQKFKVNESTGQLENPETLTPPANHVLRFTGFGPREEGDWRKLKEELIALGYAAPFMAIPKDAPSGSFEVAAEPFTPESVAALNAKGIQMNGQPLTFSIVEGDDLRNHYLARANFQARKALEEAKQRGTSNTRGGKGGRGGRGGRGGGRGGRGGNNGGRGGKEQGGAEKMDTDEKPAPVEAKPRPIDNDASAGQGTRGRTAAPVIASTE